MKQQKSPLNYAKVQALYLLKINAIETVRYLAVIMGRSELTVHYWLQLYRTGGLSLLLDEDNLLLQSAQQEWMRLESSLKSA